MWPPNLPATDLPAYVEAMQNASSKVRVEVDLLTLDHAHLGSLDREFIDGQVNFNRGQDVNASVQAGFVDLDGELLELDLRYLLQFNHHLYVPSLAEWVVTPQFCGQIVAPSSDGDVTTVEAHGKESMALQVGKPRREWKSGRRIVSAIRDMFTDLGETRFRISPSINVKLDDNFVSGGPDENHVPMKVARRMAASGGLQVFYDEQGYLVIRRRPTVASVRWSEDDATVLSPIKFSRDLRRVKNQVRASGKKKLSYTAEAEPRHNLSAQSLRRGGVNQWLPDYWDAESIGKRSELKDRAEKRLDQHLTETTDAQFECMPVRHIGPFDRVAAVKRNGSFGEFFLSEATVPLREGPMSVGYQQRQRVNSSGRIRL